VLLKPGQYAGGEK